MAYSYQIWDVFTDKPLAGNPLAVVFDADGIDGQAAQAIAAEFNLSETIFLGAGAGGVHSARIFTPMHEMPFAGHPTVGGSIAAARRGGLDAVTLELPAGPTLCRIAADGPTLRSTIRAPKLPVLEPGIPDRATLAAALGLAPDLIGAPDLAPSFANSGPQFTVIAVRSPQALADIRIDRDIFRQFGAHTSTYVIAPDGDGAFRCRMFAPLSGIDEDPATGSAAVAFCAVVAEGRMPADGAHAFTIQQGVEMGRPSTLFVTLHIAGGTVAGVDLSGTAVLVADGTLHI